MANYGITFTDNSPCLKHHGVLGQQWGKRNGPPYPLDDSISNGKRLVKTEDVKEWTKNRKKQAIKTHLASNAIATAAIIGGNVAATALGGPIGEALYLGSLATSMASIGAGAVKQLKDGIEYSKAMDKMSSKADSSETKKEIAKSKLTNNMVTGGSVGGIMGAGIGALLSDYEVDKPGKSSKH